MTWNIRHKGHIVSGSVYVLDTEPEVLQAILENTANAETTLSPQNSH